MSEDVTQLKPCRHCQGQATGERHDHKWGTEWAIACAACGFRTPRFAVLSDAVAAWNRRASTAALETELAEVRAENARMREALKSKPWPPSDADLREMLAHIVGAWWSNATAHAIRTKRVLNPEDIRGMYAVRDALAPFVSRAALLEPKP